MYIIGKNYPGSKNKQVVTVGKPINQPQNAVWYTDERKLLRTNSGSVNVSRHSNIVSIGKNQIKEQRKLIKIITKEEKQQQEHLPNENMSPLKATIQSSTVIQPTPVTIQEIPQQQKSKFNIIPSQNKPNINHSQQLHEMLQKQLEYEERKKEEDRARREDEEKQLLEFKKQKQIKDKLDDLRKGQLQLQRDQLSRQVVSEEEKVVQAKNTSFDNSYNLIIKGQMQKLQRDEVLVPSQQFKKTNEKQEIQKPLNKDTKVNVNNLPLVYNLNDKKQSQNDLDLESESIESQINKKVQLLLPHDAPRRQYYSRQWEEKEDIRHWGQRKLLLVEIWFLLTYGHLSNNVIYTGAAPGHHINYLSTLFKNHKFYLYDPNPFKATRTENIFIYQKYFTEKDAQIFKSQLKGDCLFISDIRTANHKEMTSLENEEHILEDNRLQMSWVEMIQPKRVIHIIIKKFKSMLKFRCAYPTEISKPTEFFKGDILIQPWAPQSSTETRLIPNESLERCLYDNKVYEQQMFYHNDVNRKNFYINLHSDSEGLDGSWDACAEWLILSLYIKKFYPNQDLQTAVSKLSNQVTRKIQYEHGTRQLSDKKKKPEQKILRI